MTLTGKQKNYLRGIAHAKKPIVTIGNKGLTDSVLQELDQALNQHELVKVKIPGSSKQEKAELLTVVADKSNSELVQQIGNIGVIYRASEEVKLILPE